MLRSMRKAWLLLAVIGGSSCVSPLDEVPVCGEGTDAVIVTALNGYLDEATPAVEIQLRVPETCEVQDSLWMVWDEASDGVMLHDAPDAGGITREGVEVDDRLVFFRRENLAVRLAYPTEAPSRELTFTWYTPPEPEYASVRCSAEGDTLECSVEAP